MPDYVFNPRRSPRAPIHCHAQVISAGGTFQAETEDVGMRGVQLVTPQELHKAEPIRMTLVHASVREPLEVAARVSWAGAQEPWRSGIAFDEPYLKAGRRWYEKLVDANPGLPTLDRIPERIAMDSPVLLGAPPRWVVDFTPDEALVLRAIGSGATLDDLKAKLRDRWGACQRAVFSLLARHHVTLARGEGVHPDAWKRILADLEAAAALASLAPDLIPVQGSAGVSPPRPAVAVPWRATPGQAAAPAGPAPARPAGRSADAQECYDRGVAELANGQVHSGVALLRRAAQLAPGDAEIASALSKARATAASSRR